MSASVFENRNLSQSACPSLFVHLRDSTQMVEYCASSRENMVCSVAELAPKVETSTKAPKMVAEVVGIKTTC